MARRLITWAIIIKSCVFSHSVKSFLNSKGLFVSYNLFYRFFPYCIRTHKPQAKCGRLCVALHGFVESSAFFGDFPCSARRIVSEVSVFLQCESLPSGLVLPSHFFSAWQSLKVWVWFHTVAQLPTRPRPRVRWIPEPMERKRHEKFREDLINAGGAFPTCTCCCGVF